MKSALVQVFKARCEPVISRGSHGSCRAAPRLVKNQRFLNYKQLLRQLTPAAVKRRLDFRSAVAPAAGCV